MVLSVLSVWASCISAVSNSLAVGVFIVVGLYVLLGGLFNCLVGA